MTGCVEEWSPCTDRPNSCLLCTLGAGITPWLCTWKRWAAGLHWATKHISSSSNIFIRFVRCEQASWVFFCRASYWVSFPSSNSSQLLENRCIGMRPRATMRGIWFLLKSEDDYLFPLESEANPCLCLHRRNKLFFVPVVACAIETSAGKLAIITVYPFQAWSMQPSQASLLGILPPTKK